MKYPRWRTHKFNARRCTVNGIKFPSKLEGRVYIRLLADQEDGRIRDLKLQVAYVLQESPKITYRIDFAYIDCVTDELVLIEAKGKETDVFRLKLKLFATRYPDLDLRVVTS